MKTIASEKTVMIDVDDTLVMWDECTKREINFKDPYSGELLTAWVNENNVRLLKEKARRGYTVIVWSLGGYAHAAAVVKALKLQKYVDVCMTKPSCYIDDMPVCAWFPARVYLKPNIRYKGDVK